MVRDSFILASTVGAECHGLLCGSIAVCFPGLVVVVLVGKEVLG